MCSQVFNATDTDMETLATRAMRAFLATLYPDPPITSVPVEDVDMLGDAPEASASSVQLNGVASLLLHDVFHEIEKSPDKSSAQAATKILAAAVSATSRSLLLHIIDTSQNAKSCACRRPLGICACKCSA